MVLPFGATKAHRKNPSTAAQVAEINAGHDRRSGHHSCTGNITPGAHHTGFLPSNSISAQPPFTARGS